MIIYSLHIYIYYNCSYIYILNMDNFSVAYVVKLREGTSFPRLCGHLLATGYLEGINRGS